MGNRWVHTFLLAYLWSTLAGCGWKGAPKVPIDPAYAACKQTCEGTCTADGECLPPVIQ